MTALIGFLGLLAPMAVVGQDLYGLDKIVEIRIDFEAADWDRQLDSFKQVGYENRLLATVTVNDKVYKKAGVRYKGNSSYFNVRNDESDKLPFNIKVNYTDKDLRLPGGFTTLKLSNVFRDPSFIREVLAYEIAAKYMPAPRANYARVFAGKTYLGLYNLSQSVDDDLLEDFFGSDKGILVKCDPYWSTEPVPGCPEGEHSSLMYQGQDSICYRPNYELKDDYGWKEFINLIYILNQSPTRLESVLNVDEALWMLAFNNVLVNLDSYTGRLSHNYYLYQDTFGIWHPIIWDMNLCFGGFRYTGIGGAMSNEEMQTMSPLLHFQENNAKRPLIVQLLNNGLFRKIYLAHIRTIVEENFAQKQYRKRAEAMLKLIEPEVKKDQNRLYTVEAFGKNIYETVTVDKTSIIGVAELMDKRAEYLANHPLMQKPVPAIGEVTHFTRGDEIIVTAQLEGASDGWLFYRTEKFGPWKRLAMKDNGENGDKNAGDNNWSAGLPAGNFAQYYVVAEGEYHAQLSPRRASKKFYELVVK